MKRTTLALVAATSMMVASATSSAFSAPAVVDTITVGASPWSVAFSPNGKKAYVANIDDDNVSVISVATGDVVDTISVVEGPYSVAFSPNGKRAYVANVDSGNVAVIK